MKRRALVLILITALLLLAVAGTQIAKQAQANYTPLPTLPTPIYITSDGRIEPSTAPIQRNGDTYTFTSNVINTIEVQRDNIVIDGKGFTLTQTPIDTTYYPAGWYAGINLTNRKNVTLKNIKILNCLSGINIQSSSNITITESSIIGSHDNAIFSASSSEYTISKNNVTSNNFGIEILDGKNVNVLGNNIEHNGGGIGTYAYTLAPKLEPGAVSSCAYINIIGNNIVGSTRNGITLMASFHNYMEYNTLADNNVGMYLYPSYYTTIHHNNFIGNNQSAYTGGSGYNWVWDNGSEGNYWSDYSTRYPNATEAGSSGVWNSPYKIDVNYPPHPFPAVANNTDHFPLVKPVSISEFPSTPEETENQLSEPFPTIYVIAAVMVASVATGVGLLFYFKKRKH